MVFQKKIMEGNWNLESGIDYFHDVWPTLPSETRHTFRAPLPAVGDT